jgi:hypothetical protein
MESYDCIRKIYPDNKIMIIDDNSNFNYITEKALTDSLVINSEYKGRGELLPYIYFLQNKSLFDVDIAIIVHDSVFIKDTIDVDNNTNKFLWHFNTHQCDNPTSEINLLNQLENNSQLLSLYNRKDFWRGCFGGMSIISYDFLELIHKKHNLFKLIPHIQNRNDRMCFERVFAILFYITKFTNNLPVNSISVFDCIHDFCRWGYTYEQYILDYNNNNNNINKFIFNKKSNMKKIVKTWSGR